MKKVIKIPIFKSKITIYQEDTINMALSSAHLTLDGNEHTVYGALTIDFSNRNIVFIFDYDNCTPGTISHEAKHAVNIIFDNIGYKLDSKNDEIECYLLGYIVSILHKHLKVKT